MKKPDPKTVTRLLDRARGGDVAAADSLLPLVYADLRRLAGVVFADERRNHTLQPTALIHEAWLKLARHVGAIETRQQFYAVAAQAMRRVLTDHARACKRQKRSGGRQRIALEGDLLGSVAEGLDLVELEDSLMRLSALNERHARMVELRFFAGLSIRETAEILGVSSATVERDWFGVRGWLHRELSRAS